MLGFPRGSVLENPLAVERRCGLIPESQRSPRGGKRQPPPVLLPGESQTEEPDRMPDRGAWQAAVHGVTKELGMTAAKQQY